MTQFGMGFLDGSRDEAYRKLADYGQLRGKSAEELMHELDRVSDQFNRVSSALRHALRDEAEKRKRVERELARLQESIEIKEQKGKGLVALVDGSGSMMGGGKSAPAEVTVAALQRLAQEGVDVKLIISLDQGSRQASPLRVQARDIANGSLNWQTVLKDLEQAIASSPGARRFAVVTDGEIPEHREQLVAQFAEILNKHPRIKLEIVLAGRSSYSGERTKEALTQLAQDVQAQLPAPKKGAQPRFGFVAAPTEEEVYSALSPNKTPAPANDWSATTFLIDGSGSMMSGGAATGYGRVAPLPAALDLVQLISEKPAVALWGHRVLAFVGKDISFESAKRGLYSGTEFMPAVAHIKQEAGRNPGKKQHYIVVSDGEILERAHEIGAVLRPVLEANKNVTIDFIITGSRAVTSMSHFIDTELGVAGLSGQVKTYTEAKGWTMAAAIRQSLSRGKPSAPNAPAARRNGPAPF